MERLGCKGSHLAPRIAVLGVYGKFGAGSVGSLRVQ